jgi:hypothetical protein
MLDSGAFSDWKAKEKNLNAPQTNLQEYMGYVKSHTYMFDEYVNLDVIGDEKQSIDNFITMSEKGFKPMGVMTGAYNPAHLETYLKYNPRIACGNLVGAPKQLSIKRIMKVHQLSNGRAKIHALGWTPFPALLSTPIVSCDSSSFSYGARYGMLYLFNRQTLTYTNRTQLGVGIRKRVLDTEMYDHLLECNIPHSVYRQDANWQGHRSISHLLSVHSGLLVMNESYIRNIDYHLVITSALAFTSLASIVHTMKGHRFDYQESVKMHKHLEEEFKANKKAWSSQVNNIFIKGGYV